MRLEVRGIDHQPVRGVAARRQFGEDPVEHTEPAPAGEAVVDRLVRLAGRRRVAPSNRGINHLVMKDESDNLRRSWI
jgi:hypothetical protein